MVKAKTKNKATHHSKERNKKSLLVDFRIQALVLIAVGFIFYSNTFKNEYALDDGIIIQKNDYVQQGFGGIKSILKTDSYDSFYRWMNAKEQLSGGRYRPLSVVTFAIEQQVFGSKDKDKQDTDIASVRHFFNVLFYIFSILFLLYFLKTFVFKDQPFLPFVISLLFLIHPIHTEVVANVKSRDEIFSFLFIILTFISVFYYKQTNKITHLILALLFYFFALLSKEYAISLIIFIPMLLYIVNGYTLKTTIIASIPYICVAMLYIYIRYKIVGNGGSIDNPDVLNAPFKYATNPEKWATKIEILNHYLRLLFYPHPLSSDYSYAQIPYTSFANVGVWLSILIHLSMITATIVLFIRRNILAFALAFYLVHLLLISNLVFDIGATMGERLIYHSSFGFVIIICVLINTFLKRIESNKFKTVLVSCLVLLITVGSAIKVISRNAQWKNDTSLFISDASTVPNSALANGNAGKAYLDLSEIKENKSKETELVKKAIYYLSRSVAIHKEYVNGYLNLGVAYYKLKDTVNAKKEWDFVYSIYPNNPVLKRNYLVLAPIYFTKGMLLGKTDYNKSVKYLDTAVIMDPQNADYWYNLGGAAFMIKDYEKAQNAWTNTLLLKPDNELAQKGMDALPPINNK